MHLEFFVNYNFNIKYFAIFIIISICKKLVLKFLTKINVLGTPEDITKTMVKAIKEKMINETTDEELKRKINNIIVDSVCVPEQPRATPFTPLFSIAGEKSAIPDLNLYLKHV